MARFSDFFSLGFSQPSLDFVDIDTEKDTPVYVDPYAIEIQNDVWTEQASEYIRTFFTEVLTALRNNNIARARNLMSNLREPEETFLGVAKSGNTGRGVGKGQSSQLINAILKSDAYKSGLLTDLSEMALYVEGIDRDKISDLTTNIIRKLLVDYTNQQCDLYDIKTDDYASPAMWDKDKKNWYSKHVKLPFIEKTPVLLVPKYIVRRKLSIDSQEFYNTHITDFLVAESLRANDSLVQTLKSKKSVVYKKDVREKNPKTKQFISDMVKDHPELLKTYKYLAQKQPSLTVFDDDAPSLPSVCDALAKLFGKIQAGNAQANDYLLLVLASLNVLFYPSLTSPKKEWDLNDGRKRVDIVFINAAEHGFFAHKRNNPNINASLIIVECKNYTNDIKNPEIDQLIGRFNNNRGKFGIIACRSIDNEKGLKERLKDAANSSQGFIIPLTDKDIIFMLQAKAKLEDHKIESLLHQKYVDLIS